VSEPARKDASGGLTGYFSVFASRRMLVMVLLGFSSGLPLPLTSGTLQAWLTVAGLDIRSIGVFSLVGLPYALKFLWAPLMDRFVLPWLGRRRGWVVPAQLLLFLLIGLMGLIDPRHAPLFLAVFAVLVAFTSASQDIVVDAYRTDLLPDGERGAGAALFVLGYRIAMLAAGAFALVLSDQVGWQKTYLVMAFLMWVGVAGTLLGPEPSRGSTGPKSLKEAIWGPLADFFSLPKASAILLLVVLYKLGDAYAGALTTAFLIRGVGFTVTDVGLINKAMGLIATIVGALFGGAFMVRLGLFRSLILFGVLQMVSNLSFMALAWLGHNYPMMVFAVAFENLSGGMGTAAFVAFLMAVCNPRFSATQFALLSSLSALGRVLVAPTSGYLVEATGWAFFFLLTTVIALPGLFLVWWLGDDLKNLTKR
jgi:MFS transporter, PAT family, beta-lactamase induction signal transducer AmpG